jgi:hypothetical protein
MMSSQEEARIDQEVRLAVYRHFVSTGAAPDAPALAAPLALTPEQAEASLRRLGSQHVLVLEESTCRIRMAMPFSGVPTAYRVETARGAWWANCGWDALGIPAMLNEDARIITRCQDCEAPLSLTLEHGQLREREGVLHFLVPAARWWEDIGFT